MGGFTHLYPGLRSIISGFRPTHDVRHDQDTPSTFVMVWRSSEDGSDVPPVCMRESWGLPRCRVHDTPRFPLPIRATDGISLGPLSRSGTQVSLRGTMCPPANGRVCRGLSRILPSADGPGPVARDPRVPSHPQVCGIRVSKHLLTAARTPGFTDNRTDFYVNMCVTPSFDHPDFDELTLLSSFVDRGVFKCYYGGGVGHGDPAEVAELKFDPGEVVCESPYTRFEIEDTDEESEDDDKADDPGESADEEMVNVFKLILCI